MYVYVKITNHQNKLRLDNDSDIYHTWYQSTKIRTNVSVYSNTNHQNRLRPNNDSHGIFVKHGTKLLK